MNAVVLRRCAILIAALALGMHLAHALELAPKRGWEDPQLYFQVQSSLYEYFGSIGPVFEFGALILVALVLRSAWAERQERLLPLLSTAAYALAVVLWLVLVLPDNAHLNAWKVDHMAPPDWQHWRDQWQFGQAAIFVVHLVGFSALVSSSVRR